jgi:hypothetical protein
MIKKAIFIVLVILAGLVALIALTQIDEDLSAEALALIKEVEQPKESQAYLYLIGINAAPDADPLEVGRDLLEEYRKLGVDENYQVVEYSHPNLIRAPDGELFCGFFDDDCVRTLFTSDFDIRELEREYALILERMERFYGFGDYHTLSKPTYMEILAPFQYISRVERIWVLKSISLYKEGRTQEALTLLMKRLVVLRGSMASQDNLIGKMVHLAVVSEIVDVASIILANSPDAINVELIPDMTLVEKGLDTASAREFAGEYYLYKGLDKHPEFFETSAVTPEGETEESDSKQGNAPGWYVRIFFKPNMTINAIVPIYERMARLSRLSPREFTAEIEAGEELEITTSKLRNYVGYVFISISRPNMDEYNARILDIETKIELFNQIHHHGVTEKMVRNPYYQDDFSYRKGNAVCFRGPLEDQMGMRCLRTQY